MDTHSLNYHYEEHFPAFDQNDFLNMEEGEGNMGLSTGEDIWQWEVERELNGDIALIPVSSDITTDYLSTSPPVEDDCQKMLSDWNNLMDVNEVTGDDNNLDWNNAFDSLDKKPVINNNVNRSMGKKIDMSAQCYIVENQPVNIKVEDCDIKEEPLDEVDLPSNSAIDSESDEVDVDTISEQGTPILQAGDVNSLLEQFEASEKIHIEYTEQTSRSPCSANINNSKNSSNPQTDTEKRKEILNALPQELIQRIKASSQRRVVPVIDPIPTHSHNSSNKKRSKTVKASCHRSKVVETLSIPQTAPVKVEVVPEPVTKCIQLDHDYCASSSSTSTTPYPKYPNKDSGFESAEEDEQRNSNILKNQPTVKDANGRLMVSLLKLNTIQNCVNSVKETNVDSSKKKLNLEEYKRRRKNVLSSCGSKSNSPTNSGANSPTFIEDEKSRLLKHQQKLKQMAAEVLKTPPRSKLTPVAAPPSTIVLPNVNVVPPPTPSLPENIEVKVLVSIGVNTDEVAELKEIRPILKNAIDKIDSNSLITSVIENLQNKKVKEEGKVLSNEHGEDKTIVYLDKCRPPVSTREIFVQVNMVLPEDEVIQKRRRSSIQHRKCYKRRTSSDESSYSCSSPSSSSSRSGSGSPATYSAYKRHKNYHLEDERLREVEERRIVYIGGITSITSKDDLRKRFQQFGPISNISIHFREYGDNYGFVTFAHTKDAYRAIEHGNADPSLPRFDLSFGGRRIFCGSTYSDLDNVHEYSGYGSGQQEDSFDNLLREAQAKIRKRKTCA